MNIWISLHSKILGERKNVANIMEIQENNNKKMAVVMSWVYFIIWGTQFIGQQYMSIYLRELPFTNDVTVGLTMSLAYLVTTIAQLTWGAVADHAQTKNRILTVTVLGVGFSLWLVILPQHTSFATLLPSVVLIFSFLIIPGMLVDTIVVENIGKTGVPFGAVKCFSSGGAGFVALLMFLLSLIMQIKPTTTFIIAVFNAFAALIPLRYMPITKGHARGIKKTDNKTSVKAILKNRRLVLVLCFVFFHFVAVQGANVFLGIYYATEEGLNAGIGMYGLFFAICIALETCLMRFGTGFFSRMNIYHVFSLVSLAGCARSLVIYFSPNVYVIQLCAICHALLFAPLWSRLAPYVNSIVTQETRATGQAAWSIMAFGLGPMVGAAVGGFAANRLGIKNLFLSTAGLLLLIVAVFYFLFKRQDALDKTNEEASPLTKCNV
jgi:PPP family 3-phenylpropionic acid transporter